MPTQHRIAPAIRDHETLRMIGRGAYGEVWMARSVTGALRAVKVVWREDYEHPDAFEREFQAIKHYEPVSRKHPGLVPVLQVGRSDTEGFYYYIMELADDLHQGRQIDPENYTPHTLSGQSRRDKRLSVNASIKVGINVAQGLHHLHTNGLIHRDVKPANLVFVDGVCRLADIGLVTLMGQRTFVGTEGFVAPEGPGSPASDIFSLGMVLYEASTGKDRLDFPDLPSFRDSSATVQDWRRLQEVICVACASKAGQRYETAEEMALALAGKPLPSQRRRNIFLAAIIAALALFFAGMWWAQQSYRGFSPVAADSPPLLTLHSSPEGARVFAGEEDLGATPLKLNPPLGLPVIYQLRLKGYKHTEREHTAVARKQQELTIALEKSRLPQAGERWLNSLGMTFAPRQGGHVSVQPAEMKAFRTFTEEEDRAFEGKVVRMHCGKEAEPSYIVVVPLADAEAFRAWLTDRDRRSGYLSQEHTYELETFYYVESEPTEETPDAAETTSSSDEAEREWQAFHLRVVRQTYGTVVLRTSPEGVQVYQHETYLGDTPLELPRVRTGTAEFELHKEKFTDLLVDGEVKEGEILELYADMEEKKGVSYGREWKNSQGIRFVPLGDVLMSIWETRRRDYVSFCKATNRRIPTVEDVESIDMTTMNDGKAKREELSRRGTSPVVSITREEARAYCAWLTEKERAEKVIGPDDEYRLPTDTEWSRAVGLPMERGRTPAERNGRIRGMYPWGFDWPPPTDTDNLADQDAAKKAGLSSTISGYKDRGAYTVKVADLPPNDRGICGLGGNVSEWVDTDYDKSDAKSNAPPMGTTRGGSWRTANPEEALSSTRQAVPAQEKRNTIGFRVVLSRK